MLGFRLFLCLACIAAVTNSCLIPDKKDDQEVHIFHIGSSKEPEVIELHIPGDGREKRAVPKSNEHASSSCVLDNDCPPDAECEKETSQCHYPPKHQDSSKPGTSNVYLIPIN